MKKRNKIELREATLLSDSDMKKVIGGTYSDPGECRSANGWTPQCAGSCQYSQIGNDGVNYVTYTASCSPMSHVVPYYSLYTCYCEW